MKAGRPQRLSMKPIGSIPSACESPREHPNQGCRHRQVSQKLSERHVPHARPEGQSQPTGHSAEWISDDGQECEQTSHRAHSLQPSQGMDVCAGMTRFVHHLVRAISHAPRDHSAQGVAYGGYDDGGPEQIRVEGDQAIHGWFGPQGEQSGGDERHHKNRAQTNLGQGQPAEQRCYPIGHVGARNRSRKNPETNAKAKAPNTAPKGLGIVLKRANEAPLVGISPAEKRGS